MFKPNSKNDVELCNFYLSYIRDFKILDNQMLSEINNMNEEYKMKILIEFNKVMEALLGFIK